ncbi:hybrid sensor histidine kinase/response regulator [Ensifer soli]|uniref:hybrid sensor histidine kinase/response regulator n=1 Tax=Ciceribacter sp. sgz301302 TaxID=3342379 RepID=UPI0035B705E0
MSELFKLQQRIETEFGVRAPLPGGALDYDAIVPAGEAAEALARDEDRPDEDRYPALKPALAGGGLIGSALLLGSGIDASVYMMAGGVALAGIAGVIFILRGWQPKKGADEAGLAIGRDPGESVRDRQWERSEATHLLSTIHDALGDIAVIRDNEGKIVEANSVFCEMTGWLSPRGLTCEAIGIVFENVGQQHRFRVAIDSLHGRKIFDWHDVIVRDGAHGRFMVQSIARDITEETLRNAQAERARKRAEAASRAKSRLLATVSHDIRTPLAGILGMSHLLSQTRLTPEQKNYLAGMRQSGHALVQLVDDLLDFSSIEAGRFQLRPAEERLREIIENVVEMLAHRAHEKDIEIGACVEAGVPGLMTFDAPRLRQVLFNVIGNAVKFTHAGGVSVHARVDGGDVVIAIEDTGPGMSAGELARVFDEYEQAGPNDQRAAGTGLGLAISRRIMEAFGGTLTASSREGAGSRFEIRFPVAGADIAEAARSREGVLAGSAVLVIAPQGPASAALAATVTTLGGACFSVATAEQAELIAARALSGRLDLTDIIVDHRHAAQFHRLLQLQPALAEQKLRRTYLINPEERTGRPINQMDGYDAWLIRPLREKSLIDVLKGRMRGMEVRDAINDNRPVLRDVLPPVEAPEPAGVLIAEDDPVVALLVRSVLERAGHDVRVVNDFGALAQALYDQPHMRNRIEPQLIITDLNMPGGDGFEMLARLRASEEEGRPHRPVLVLTSDTRPEKRRELYAAGADCVMTKPADPRQLMTEVDRLLATRG